MIARGWPARTRAARGKGAWPSSPGRARGSLSTRVLPALLVLSVPLVACAREGGAPKNAVEPTGAPVSIAPRARLSVGVAEGNPAQQFGRVVTPFLLPDSELVVPDAQAGEIRVFGADGRLARSLGRPGHGPGEFASLGAAWARGDTIEAFDNALGRITQFLPGGGTRVVQLDRVASAQMAVPGALPDGWIVAGVASAGMGRRDDMVVHRFTRDGAHAGVIARVQGMARVRTPVMSGPGPLSPRAVFAVGDDLVYVGETLTPAIRVLSPTGALERELTWTPAAAPSPRAALDAVVKTAVARAGPDRVAETRRVLLAFPLPDRVSAFWTILVDADGFVWVQRYDPRRDAIRLSGLQRAGPGGTWRIFSPDGAPAGTVRVPDGLELTQIGERSVVGVRRDSLGVESVEVHDLSRYRR